MQNLNPIKPPFYKLKKFYIPFVLFIALFVILISLAHRPLELVLWQEEYFEKEQAMLQEYNHIYWNKYFHSIDKQEFIDFRQTHNIESEFKELRKELLKYMYNFEFDFKIAKILNLEQFYFQALNSKVKIYSDIMDVDLHYLGGNEQIINDALNFMKNYEIFLENINKINDDDTSYFQRAIVTNWYFILINASFWNLVPKEQTCFIDYRKEILSKLNMIQNNIYKLYDAIDKTKILAPKKLLDTNAIINLLEFRLRMDECK